MKFIDVILGIVALTLGLGVLASINTTTWHAVSAQLDLPPILREGWKPSGGQIPVFGDVIAAFSWMLSIITGMFSLLSSLLTVAGVPKPWADAIVGGVSALATIYLIYFIRGGNVG